MNNIIMSVIIRGNKKLSEKLNKVYIYIYFMVTVCFFKNLVILLKIIIY